VLEAYASEIAVVKNEIKYALNNVGSWSKTRRIHSPKHLFPGRSYIMPEPWGVSLIIAPGIIHSTLHLHRSFPQSQEETVR